MIKNKLSIIFNRLKKSKFQVVGPKACENEVIIAELDKVPSTSLLSAVSDRSYKYFLMPAREVLYRNEGVKIKQVLKIPIKTALFGMSIFDLKALELYDHVFRNDIYFNKRRKDLFIIGYSSKLLSKIKTSFFDFDKDILENVIFDIFIEKTSKGYIFYSGSKSGSAFLRACKISAKHVKHNPKYKNEAILPLKEAIEKSKNSKLWKKLNKICLACGKCTLVCPTCFCFDIESTIGPKRQVTRTSGNCFYDDFSRIAGGHKFLNNSGEKLYFWYYHKFVRIPYEYGLPGCVDCGRCTKVCPVGIDIQKNMKQLLREAKMKK